MPQGLRSLLADMQSRTVLCFPLFEREHSSAKISELGQFLLDRSEPLLPLAVSKLSPGFIVALTPILVVQILKVCDLCAETPNLFPKHCEMIHDIRIAHPQTECRSPIPSANVGLSDAGL